MGRKKEEREAKADHKKARRLAKEAAENEVEDDSISLAHQLAPLGLQVREIPGDGNCLFRAVCDQLEGNSRNHMEYRANTVEYMKHFRDDFEPFVEDDVPFDRHTANLRKSGTFAGNDALVALARYLKISIVIHQSGQPIWQINGGADDGAKARQIHLSYHNGEHYNSVRRVGDHSNTPSTIVTGKTVSSRPKDNDVNKNEIKDNHNKIEKENNHNKNSNGKKTSSSGRRDSPDNNNANSASSSISRHSSASAVATEFDEMDVLINEVIDATGMADRTHVRRLLVDHNCDVSAVIQFYTFTALAEEDQRSEVNDEDNEEDEDGVEKGSREENEHLDGAAAKASSMSSSARPRMSRPELARSKVKSTKEKRKEKREEKKARQAERNRRKLVGEDGETAADDDGDLHVLTQELKCLDL